MTDRPATLTVAALMVLMFLVQLQAGAGEAPLLNLLLYPHQDVLLKAGAAYTGMDLGRLGWRIIASIFIHGGVLHLAVNLVALLQLGRLLEVFFGTAAFLASFLLGALGAALAMLVIPAEPGIVYVGASGGIFALAGTLFVGLRRVWREERERWTHQLSSNLIGCMALNLVFGVAVSVIAASVGAGFMVANTAHVGGLLTGAAVGLLPLRIRRNAETQRLIRRMEPPPPPSHRPRGPFEE